MKEFETAMFAAGCFWHVQEAFDKVKGINSTVVGYTGGTISNPSYEQVCSGSTEHFEAIKIDFDPNIVSFVELLRLFFKIHNPFQANGQGVDIGAQYRSAIFYFSEKQKQLAFSAIIELEKEKNSKAATLVLPAKDFFAAEDYHQKYYLKHKGLVCGV